MTKQARARLMAFAIGLIALGSLIWLAVAVSSDATRDFDSAVRNTVHNFASPALTAIAEALSLVGSILFLSIASVVSLVGLLLARLRREAIRLACVMTGSVGIENGLKYGIHRARPEAFFGIDPTTFSFPSGHSLFSLCFYGVVAGLFARRLPDHFGRSAIWAGAAVLVAAIGLSRIYLGVHYPTDVIGGFLSAVFWVSLVIAAEKLWWPSAVPVSARA